MCLRGKFNCLEVCELIQSDLFWVRLNVERIYLGFKVRFSQTNDQEGDWSKTIILLVYLNCLVC